MLIGALSKLLLFLLAVGIIVVVAFLQGRRRRAAELLRHLEPLPPTSEDAPLRVLPRRSMMQPSGRLTQQSQLPAELTYVNLQTLEWRRIEELTAYIFSAEGWRAEMTSDGFDGGIDIKLNRKDSPSRRAYVQCKAWSNQIGVKPVRELYGVMAADSVTEGYFVATGSFTADARAFAAGKTLHLVGGSELISRFTRLSVTDRARILEHVFRGDFSTPSCPQCSSKMVLKGGPEQFWACPRFPVCRSQPIHRRKSAMASRDQDCR